MKARVTASELHRATAWAVKSAGGGGQQLAALAGVLIEAEAGGRIEVTSYNVQSVATTTITAAVDEPGRLVAPATLIGVLAAMGDRSADLALESDRLHVRSQDRSAELALLSVEDYPDIPRRTEASSKAEGLTHALSLVLPAIPSSVEKGRREYFKGAVLRVRDGLLYVYASDGFHLLSASLAWEGSDIDVLVPLVGVQAAARMGEPLVLHVDDRLAWFCDGDQELATRLIQDQAPDYVAYLAPMSDVRHTLDVSVSDFTDALRYAAQVRNNNEFPSVWVNATPDGISVTSAATHEKGSTEAGCEAVLTGDPVRFAVNATLLENCLRSIDAPDARLSLNDRNKPIHISRPGEPALAMCMPIRSQA